MQAVHNGVATQILAAIQPKAVYTHCYGHSLNLACQDMIRNIKPLRDALDTTHELSKLLKYSTTRKAEYMRLRQEIARVKLASTAFVQLAGLCGPANSKASSQQLQCPTAEFGEVCKNVCKRQKCLLAVRGLMLSCPRFLSVWCFPWSLPALTS